MHIHLVGAGRMGSAMLRGWIASPINYQISVTTLAPHEEILAWATDGKIELCTGSDRLQIARSPTNEAVKACVLAVKPQTFLADTGQFSSLVEDDVIIISVMAGISIETLQTVFGTPNIVRAMPNTPGAIGKGVTLLAPEASISTEIYSEIERLFTPLGLVEGPLSEPALQLGTALSGCGPAYFFYFTDMLAAAGRDLGLDTAQAERLARQTLVGAASLVAQSGGSLSDLREAVASPGGVTRAALDVMIHDDRLRKLLSEALAEALKRDAELAQ